MLKYTNANFTLKSILLVLLCMATVLCTSACGVFDEVNKIFGDGNDSRPVTDASGDASDESTDASEIIPDTSAELFEVSAYGDGCMITGYTGTEAFVKIPSQIDGKEVVALSVGVFKDSESFHVTDVVVPNTVKQIAFSAFSECKKLVSLTVPFVGGKADEHGYIGYVFGAYSASGNKSVLPETLVSVCAGGSVLSDDAFKNCDSIQSITLDGITSVGKNAFSGCESLKTLLIPDSVTDIGEGAFNSCESLAEITLPFLGNGSDKLFFGAVFGAESYEKNHDYVPASLRRVTISCPSVIPSGAFYECNGLVSVTVKTPVSAVSERAFYRCRKLKSLDITAEENKTIGSVSDYAFAYCAALSEIKLSGDITTIPDGAFYGCSALRTVYFGDSSNAMPDTVTFLGKGAFAYCESLSAMALSTSLTEVEEQAFYGCSYLLSVNIPSGVTEIKKDAFKGCGNLKTLTVSSSLTTIGYGAFSYCTSLVTVSLPENVSVFGDYAFAYCKYLSDMSIKCNDARLGKGVFEGCERIIVTVDPNSQTYTGLIEAGLGNSNLKVPA